jgi:hypothetical protein
MRGLRVEISRSEPSLQEVWDGLHCADCLSTVVVSMTHFHRSMVRVIHAQTCPQVPRFDQNVYLMPLPTRYGVDFRPQEGTDQ